MEKNNPTTIDSIHMLCCAVFFWNGRTLWSPQRCPHLLCGTGGRGTGGTGGVIPKTFPQGRTLEWQERHGVTKGPDSRHAHGMNEVHPKGMVGTLIQETLQLEVGHGVWRTEQEC